MNEKCETQLNPIDGFDEVYIFPRTNVKPKHTYAVKILLESAMFETLRPRTAAVQPWLKTFKVGWSAWKFNTVYERYDIKLADVQSNCLKCPSWRTTRETSGHQFLPMNFWTLFRTYQIQILYYLLEFYQSWNFLWTLLKFKFLKFMTIMHEKSERICVTEVLHGIEYL